ncbi:MAG: radical SAM protein [Magnetococcales bacterium]|nr:radical SAM protein [Magnetococcales bacterium]MBF0115677.1 radical SAM protein [Magnetococcales bacterium]
MELVQQELIQFPGERGVFVPLHFATYQELQGMAAVAVDQALNLLMHPENVALFHDYLHRGERLVPIVRSSPNFQRRPDLPSRVLLEMTSRCNLKCNMCPRQSLERPSIDMPKGLIKNCIDALDAFGLEGIWIFNLGESILHPDFPELLDYVSEKKNLGMIWLSSNGRDLHEGVAEKIIRSQVTYMNMSVNADNPETYSQISPNTDWQRQIAHFHRFIDLKRASGRRTPFTRVQIIDQECARDEIDAFLRRYAGYADILAVNTLEAFSQEVESNQEYAQQRKRTESKSCKRIGRSDLFIFSNGETTLCGTDFNGKLALGNVKEMDIRAIWNSDFRRNLIALNAEGRLNEVELCRNCMDFDL